MTIEDYIKQMYEQLKEPDFTVSISELYDLEDEEGKYSFVIPTENGQIKLIDYDECLDYITSNNISDIKIRVTLSEAYYTYLIVPQLMNIIMIKQVQIML